MSSSVPAVKAALRVLLEANAWPAPSPTFRWGAPTEGEDIPKTGELVYFDGTDMSEDHVVLGGGRGDESYNVRIVVETRLEGDEVEQLAEERGWALYDSLRTLLHEHRNLIDDPGTLCVRLEGRRVRQANGPGVGGWLSRIVVDQEVVGLVFNP